MAENSKESGQLEGEVTEPTVTPSTGEGTQTSAADVEAIVEALLPHIDERVQRATQSTKDKRIAKLQGSVDGFAEQLAELEELKGHGWSQEQALDIMGLQGQPLATMPGGSTDTATPTGEVGIHADGTDPQASVVDTKTILTATGLDANDPDVITLIGKGANAEGYIALAAQRKAQPETEPNAAQALPVGGGATVTESTLEETTAELQAALAKVPVDIKKVRELKAKQAELLKQ